MRLLRIFALVAFVLALTPSPAVAVTGFDSAYSGESAFVTISQGESASFQVFFMNTGTVAWTKGSDTQVDLAQCLADKVTCNAQDPGDATWNNGWMSLARYTTHTQTIVSTGSIATFAYNIKAPSDATGTHRFNGDLVLAKTGDRIHPEGYYQDATIDATGSVTVPTPSPTPGSTPFPSPPPPTGPPPAPTPTPTPVADLSVTKTDDPDPVVRGNNITYTLTATNAGPSDAQNVELTDVIPANTEFVSFMQTSGPAFSLSGPPVDGTVGATASTFAAGASATFTLVVSVSGQTSGGTVIANTVTVTSTTTDSNGANNSATETTQVNAAAGTLVVQNRDGEPSTVICPDGDTETADLTFIADGLTPLTDYLLRNDLVGTSATFDFPFTTDALGAWEQAFDATGASGQWTAVVVTTGRTPVTNSVTWTFTCQP